MTAAKEHEVGGLWSRLAALEEERAILDALYRYGHAIDYGLEKEWVGCFAPAGAFEMRHRLAADGVSTSSGRWDATDRRLEGHILGVTRSGGDERTFRLTTAAALSA
jgi:hypothetical protein